TRSQAWLAFARATRRVTRTAPLAAPTTHAAAAALGRYVYVIGGRGAVLGTLTAAVEAIDPVRRRVIRAGTLQAARSDLAAVGLPGKILLVGGREASGTVATVSQL